MITQQWIKENVCATCGMVITNRWDNHRIYKECEKELAKKGAKARWSRHGAHGRKHSKNKESLAKKRAKKDKDKKKKEDNK